MEALSNSRIEATYRERTRRSAELAKEARDLFPSGITHDSRKLDPYTIYVDRAQGPRKWDVDGNEYIDYFGGHGALMLGHHHPDIDRVIVEALGRGTHFGSSHEGEVRWAQAVKKLVSSAERVRFTSSGTEATHLALRIARAATGRRKVMRFRTHFHGWHDHMTAGYSSHFDGSATPGVLDEVAGSVVLLDPGDEAAMRETLAGDPDIAAAILEPTGASFGLIPLRPTFLEALREATQEAGTLLIFDEVVTGFRVSPGGAQGAFGISPDLSTFAKILAGGLPGGGSRWAEGPARLPRLRGDLGGRAREDQPSGHLQREPGIGGSRHGDAPHRRLDRCLRARQRLRRAAARRLQRGPDRRRRALGRLRHVLRLSPSS